MASLQDTLEVAVQAYTILQKDYSAAVSNRTTLESQLKENEAVQKEFGLLKDDAKVFKLMGPVLVLTETPEAKANVSKRIEYIRLEIIRNEGVLKDLQDKSDKKKMEIVQMQTALQQQQQGQEQQQQGQQVSVA